MKMKNAIMKTTFIKRLCWPRVATKQCQIRYLHLSRVLLLPKENISDALERLNEQGFLDDKHAELLSKVEDPEVNISFEQFQSDVKKLKDYVDEKKGELGSDYKLWRQRDDEMIGEARAMVYNEIKEQQHQQKQEDSAETNKRKNENQSESERPAKTSLLDDYADPNLEQPGYMDMDD